MYNDHRKGYNSNFLKEVLIQKLIRTFGNGKKYDLNGNVIRNYKDELLIVSENETNQLLPQIETNYFDGHKKFSEHMSTDNQFVPTIKVVATPDSMAKVDLITQAKPKPIVIPNITVELIQSEKPAPIIKPDFKIELVNVYVPSSPLKRPNLLNSFIRMISLQLR